MPDDQRPNKRPRRTTRPSGSRPTLAAASHDAPSVALLQGKQGIDAPASRRRATRPRPRLNKSRLSLVLLGFAVLAVISTIFGMMMAVASDLPSLEATNEFKASRNSILYDHTYSGKDPDKHRIAVLTGNENRILVESKDISPSIKQAVVAIEDKRFYQPQGPRLPGHRARSLVRRPSAEGGRGWLDRHAAVRQERAARADQPLRLPKTQGSGARLPARAQVDEGQDPHPVPEHGLFR